MGVLVVNSILYWVTALIFRKKDGLTLFSFLWLYYAVFSVFGVILMKDDLYFSIEGVDSDAEMHIMPYIYMYFSFLLITLPLRHIRRDTIYLSPNLYNNKRALQLCKLLLAVSVIYLCLKFYQLYLVYQIGFGLMHELDGDSMIYPGAIGWLLRILNMIGRFNIIVLMPIAVYYTIYGYLRGYLNKKLFLEVVVVFGVATLIVGAVGGSRGSMFFGIMNLTYYVVFFWNVIPRKIKRTFFIITLAFSIVVYFIMMEITEYRFGDSMSVGDSILSYLGQVWPNANYRIWEQPTSYPMGRRWLPFLFGTTNLDSDYWYYHSNITGWLFHSVWGFFYTEFGEYIGFLFIILISLLFRMYLKKSRFFLYEIGVIYFFYFFSFTAIFNLALSYMDYLGWFLSFLFVVFIRHSNYKALFV